MPYLCNQEVHIFLDKDVNLFLKDGLDLVLTLAAEVRGSLGDSTCHQSVTLTGHLPGQVTSCLIYLLTLKRVKCIVWFDISDSCKVVSVHALQAVGLKQRPLCCCQTATIFKLDQSEQLQPSSNTRLLTVKL